MSLPRAVVLGGDYMFQTDVSSAFDLTSTLDTSYNTLRLPNSDIDLARVFETGKHKDFTDLYLAIVVDVPPNNDDLELKTYGARLQDNIRILFQRLSPWGVMELWSTDLKRIAQLMRASLQSEYTAHPFSDACEVTVKTMFNAINPVNAPWTGLIVYANGQKKGTASVTAHQIVPVRLRDSCWGEPGIAVLAIFNFACRAIPISYTLRKWTYWRSLFKTFFTQTNGTLRENLCRTWDNMKCLLNLKYTEQQCDPTAALTCSASGFNCLAATHLMCCLCRVSLTEDELAAIHIVSVPGHVLLRVHGTLLELTHQQSCLEVQPEHNPDLQPDQVVEHSFGFMNLALIEIIHQSTKNAQKSLKQVLQQMHPWFLSEKDQDPFVRMIQCMAAFCAGKAQSSDLQIDYRDMMEQIPRWEFWNRALIAVESK